MNSRGNNWEWRDLGIKQLDMKLIIAGSRTISSMAHVIAGITNSGFEPTEVVSGGALGPDSLGASWAELRNIPVTYFLPDWNKYGKKAGMLRNQTMADYADALLAIFDGKSRGTSDMIRRMQKANKPFYVHLVKSANPNIVNSGGHGYSWC